MSSQSIQPDLVRSRRRAKDLLRAAKNGDLPSLQFIASHAPNLGVPKLAVAQLAIARSEGYASWAQLKKAAETAALDQLFEAVEQGDLETTGSLLQEFPNLAVKRAASGRTLLHAGVWSDNPDLVRLLLASGAPRDEMWESSAHTALSWAATIGSLRAAEALIEAGAPTDLFTAAGLGLLDRVKSFWVDNRIQARPSQTGSSRFDAYGAKLPRPPETASEQVSDALYIAARSGHQEVVRWLIAHGADPNFRGYEGGTALHWGEFSNNPSICELLRTAGASDELRDYTFLATPREFGLICPAAYGMIGRLKARLDSRPEDIDIMGGWGTALNAAVWNNQRDAAMLLLSRGANPSLTNAAGLTPLELAQSRGFVELASEIRAAIATR